MVWKRQTRWPRPTVDVLGHHVPPHRSWAIDAGQEHTVARGVEELGDVSWTTQHVDDPWLIRDRSGGLATSGGSGGWKHETADSPKEDIGSSRWRHRKPRRQVFRWWRHNKFRYEANIHKCDDEWHWKGARAPRLVCRLR